jgi:NAD(P)-dependent dehydrogenase (short-subunit alcohol dehydrogenase family)
MTGRLNGKIALVTGGSRGIGRGIALRLAEDGCAVVAFTYHSDEAAAQATAASLEKIGAVAVPIRAQLEDPADIDALFAALDASLTDLAGGPNFDILVNNAGTGGWGTLTTETAEAFDRSMAVNARAPFLVTRAAAPRLRDGGRIINISSVFSTRPSTQAVAYSMAKAAVNTLTTIAAAELGPRGITVNTVAPGWTATDANARARQDPALAEQVAGFTVAGRMAEPADVAGVVAMFAAPEGAWLTAQYVDAHGRYQYR